MDALMHHKTKETRRLAQLSRNLADSSSATSSGSVGAAALEGVCSTRSKDKDSAVTTPDSRRKMKPLALGFDVEWRPAYVKGCSCKVSVVQLSTANSVLLIQLSERSEAHGTLTPLRDLMISPEVRLVGVGVTNDVKRLDNDHGKCVCCLCALCCVRVCALCCVVLCVCE
jgi:hypothetical protein